MVLVHSSDFELAKIILSGTEPIRTFQGKNEAMESGICNYIINLPLAYKSP